MTLIILKVLAILCGAVSAALWLCAARTKKLEQTEPDESGIIPGGTFIDYKGESIDVAETLWAQALWSGRAAWAAAGAAALTVIALVVELLS